MTELGFEPERIFSKNYTVCVFPIAPGQDLTGEENTDIDSVALNSLLLHHDASHRVRLPNPNRLSLEEMVQELPPKTNTWSLPLRHLEPMIKPMAQAMAPEKQC